MTCISYVVTVYNKAPYLPFVLAGLAAQRGGFDRQFVFVDDGSTDGSAEVLRRATAGWADVTIVEQPNQGPSLALNRALALARGDFIKPMDGDDVLLPDATAALLDAIGATGAALAYGGQGTYRADAGTDPAGLLAPAPAPAGGPARTAVEIVPDSLRQSLRRAQMTPSAWLATAAAVRASGGCDPQVFIQDYSIELRLARLTRFARLPQPVFLAPEAAPGRLSDQKAQTLHDLNLALANFLAAHRDLDPAERRFALRRAAGRAWHWARRHGGSGFASADFRRLLAARLALCGDEVRAVRASCTVFRCTHPIRLCGP